MVDSNNRIRTIINAGMSKPVPTKNGNNKVVINNPNATSGVLVIFYPNGSSYTTELPYGPGESSFNPFTFTGADVCCANIAPAGSLEIDVEISLI